MSHRRISLRLWNQELSKIASEIRYEIYTIEIDWLSCNKFKKFGGNNIKR